MDHPPPAGGSKSLCDFGEGSLPNVPIKHFARHKNLPANNRRAKELRQSGSVVKRILWHALRTHPEQKLIKFRFQHPIRPYIADFVCLSAHLIIEIDGPSHDATPDRDKQRQEYFEDKGYIVLRFSNTDVLNNVCAVVATIRQRAKELLHVRWIHDPSPKSQSDFDPPARGG